MNLSQAKIDLAVLYKLHQHAERGGEQLPPREIIHLFKVDIPLRRIELALAELENKGDVENEYHPFHMEEGLWQISRGGLERVDRALRVSTSFIARLHQHGDDWLESAEAEQAVLKKLTPTPNPLVPQEERRDTDRIAQTVPVHIINTFAPANSQNLSVPSSDNADGRSAARAGWANVWIALAVGVAVILVTLWVAGKL